MIYCKFAFCHYVRVLCELAKQCMVLAKRNPLKLCVCMSVSVCACVCVCLRVSTK
uniref:Uncharacterized protein n=1 Tax=Anguilla anguilla TaxID=7936 RepID=A0A0E9WV01_ANGAN